jgi:hypothetical protein
MAELVDAPDSKSGSGNRVWVRFPLPAPGKLPAAIGQCLEVVTLLEVAHSLQ